MKYILFFIIMFRNERPEDRINQEENQKKKRIVFFLLLYSKKNDRATATKKMRMKKRKQIKKEKNTLTPICIFQEDFSFFFPV